MSYETTRAEVKVLLRKWKIRIAGDDRKSVKLKAGRIKYGQTNEDNFIDDLAAIFSRHQMEQVRLASEVNYARGKAAALREKKKPPSALEGALNDVALLIEAKIKAALGRPEDDDEELDYDEL